jgi:hypothetical protein
MNRCPNCKKTISEYATVCPHCKTELNLTNAENINSDADNNYFGSLVWEIISYLVPTVIILAVMILQEAVNKSGIENLGTNALDAYSLCQNSLGIFKRFLVLMVVFSICGAGNYFLMKMKKENKKELRIAIGIIGVIVYTSILVLICINPNVGGREDLIVYVRTLTRTMGMFCGLTYGFMAASMGYFFSKKEYVMFFIEAAVNTLILIVGSFVFVKILRLGIASLYNMIIAVIVIIVSVIPMVLSKKKNI